MSQDDNSYRVNLQQLDDAITAMATFGSEVDAHLSEVDTLVAALHLDWSSSAAEAQRAAHDKWMAGAGEMRENLDELREVAKRAHTSYTTATQTNREMWP
ncbi:WXG100 family type VII secretion target [Nocardia ignorata]|uniref:ESAT-6-like protein n=1 Tax=Nocardia ignorata TaxID=145285 RepID=A0A4R6PVC2_NOCIG|nr:WXG100 family type VII secretion target [Nocardia ignorata]TDP42818.1 WXG100 family type VII secretion target [Nocardia ignorata]